MTPWEILGIDHSATRKEVKKAYGKLIRKYRPDDDPVGFQQAREAYEVALTYLKANQDHAALQSDTNPVVPLESTSLMPKAPEKNVDFNTTPATASDLGTDDTEDALLKDQFQTYLADVEEHFNQYSKNSKFSTEELIACRAGTLELLQRDIAHHYNSREALSLEVFELILQKIIIRDGFLATETNMPNQMLLCFDEHFLWTLDELNLHEYYGEDTTSLIFYSIHEARKPSQQSWTAIDFDLNKIRQRDSNVFLLADKAYRFLGKSMLLGCIAVIPMATLWSMQLAINTSANFSAAMLFSGVMATRFALAYLNENGPATVWHESWQHILFGTLTCLVSLAALTLNTELNFSEAATFLAIPPVGFLIYHSIRGTL